MRLAVSVRLAQRNGKINDTGATEETVRLVRPKRPLLLE